MRSWSKAIPLLFFVAAASSACEAEPPSGFLIDADTTATFEALEIPEEYRELTNPFDGDDDQAAQGEVLYQANCSSCHGVSGEGDGPAAAGLEPRPRNLAEEIDSLSDAYLFWRISDGGLMEPFNSVMPNWRGIMDEEQIWQVISYLRTLNK